LSVLDVSLDFDRTSIDEALFDCRGTETGMLGTDGAEALDVSLDSDGPATGMVGTDGSEALDVPLDSDGAEALDVPLDSDGAEALDGSLDSDGPAIGMLGTDGTKALDVFVGLEKFVWLYRKSKSFVLFRSGLGGGPGGSGVVPGGG
jgi:hypothetical protein